MNLFRKAIRTNCIKNTVLYFIRNVHKEWCYIVEDEIYEDSGQRRHKV